MEPADESIYKVLADLFRYRDYGNHAEGDRGVVRWELRATLVTCRPAREQLNVDALRELLELLLDNHKG